MFSYITIVVLLLVILGLLILYTKRLDEIYYGKSRRK
jgi:hypothetical protein